MILVVGGMKKEGSEKLEDRRSGRKAVEVVVGSAAVYCTKSKGCGIEKLEEPNGRKAVEVNVGSAEVYWNCPKGLSRIALAQNMSASERVVQQPPE